MPLVACQLTALVACQLTALVACQRERPTPAATAPSWHYRLRPAADLRTLAAEVCFAGRVPARLDAQNAFARSALVAAYRVRQSTPVRLRADADGLDLSEFRPGDCARYIVDLAAVASARDNALSARQYGEDLFLSPDFWLWKPAGSSADAGTDVLADVALTASFDLPPGVRVAVPWPRVAPHGPMAGPYRIPRTTFAWRIHAALGRFVVRTVNVGTARLHIAVLGTGWRVPERVLHDWIAAAADAVTTLFGDFPVPEATALLVPTPGNRVVFGNTAQGGGSSIALMVGVDATPTSLRDDWVAVHELVHLGMPMLDDSGSWLSEGIATYYEPIIRARAGWISPRRAWELLHDGFQRGAAQGTGRSLSDESRDMRQTRQYVRVYWAGAALAFIADVRLRQYGAPAPTLDAQMRAIRDCCLRQNQLWAPAALLDRVAAPLGLPDFGRIAGPHLKRSEFPDVSATYGLLGLTFDAQGQLHTSPSSAALQLREAIIPRPGTTPADR